MPLRRLLLYCARSFMKSFLPETPTRSIQTSAAELFYLRHLRSAACASSGSQRSPQTSLTILVAMPLLFLTAIDVEKAEQMIASLPTQGLLQVKSTLPDLSNNPSSTFAAAVDEEVWTRVNMLEYSS